MRNSCVTVIVICNKLIGSDKSVALKPTVNLTVSPLIQLRYNSEYCYNSITIPILLFKGNLNCIQLMRMLYQLQTCKPSQCNLSIMGGVNWHRYLLPTAQDTFNMRVPNS